MGGVVFPGTYTPERSLFGRVREFGNALRLNALTLFLTLPLNPFRSSAHGIPEIPLLPYNLREKTIIHEMSLYGWASLFVFSTVRRVGVYRIIVENNILIIDLGKSET
jgi:hypothetical protein